VQHTTAVADQQNIKRIFTESYQTDQQLISAMTLRVLVIKMPA